MQNKYHIAHPVLVFIAGWLVWFLVFWVSPFLTDLDYYLRHPAFELWLSCLGYFFAGMVLALFLKGKTKGVQVLPVTSASFSQRFLAILIVCFVLDTLQAIDFIYKSGAALDLTRAREEFRTSDSLYPANIFNTIFIFFKLSIFPVFLAFLFRSVNRDLDKKLFYFSLLIALYALSNLLIFGKRGFMIFTLGVYVSYFIYFRLYKTKGAVLKSMAIITVLFMVSYITFNARYGGAAFAILNSIQAEASYAGTVLPTPEIIEDIENDINLRENFSANLKIALINFAQYYTHGTFEFFNLYDYNIDKPRTKGAITLSMPYKVLDFIGLINFNEYKMDPHWIDPKPWIFDSFLGGQLKDWGENAPYSMFVIGFIFSLLYRAAQASHYMLPLYAVFCNLTFFMPVTDIVYNTQGWHYIMLSILFYFYMRGQTQQPAASGVSNKISAKKYQS